jgi:hypothetical protein
MEASLWAPSSWVHSPWSSVSLTFLHRSRLCDSSKLGTDRCTWPTTGQLFTLVWATLVIVEEKGETESNQREWKENLSVSFVPLCGNYGWVLFLF